MAKVDKVTKTHIESNTLVHEMQLADAAWEVMRFGGYDITLPANRLFAEITRDLENGLPCYTSFYIYKAA